MSSKEKILEALSKIKHPDKGKDIVSLGMVSEIQTGKMEYQLHLHLKSRMTLLLLQ
jgi:metal-sulfur cluster biosynthetic enzyme